MECVVCERPVPAETQQCPSCGEPLGQWLELDAAARDLFSEGVALASAGHPVRAAAALIKAVILNPSDPASLKALGQLLAQHGGLEEAAYYFQRHARLVEAGAAKADAGVDAALAKLKQLTAAAPPSAPVPAAGAGAADEPTPVEAIAEPSEAPEASPASQPVPASAPPADIAEVAKA